MASNPQSQPIISGHQKFCGACHKTEKDTAKKLLLCTRCRKTYYCDSTCQKLNFKDHKPNCSVKKINLDLEDILKTFWEQILKDPELILFPYSGNQVIDGERYWFFNETGRTRINNQINQLKWYTSYFCMPTNNADHSEWKPMTENEFFKFWSVGKCSVFTFSLAYLLSNLLKSENPEFCITLNNKKIKKAKICDMDIEVDYEKQVNCYEMNRHKKHHSKWDCERLGKDEHSSLIVFFEEELACVIDLTHFQYGLEYKSLKNGYPYYPVILSNIFDDDDVIGKIIPRLGTVKNAANARKSIENTEKFAEETNNEYLYNHIRQIKDISRRMFGTISSCKNSQ